MCVSDNIASPLAACLGDFLTLFILALIGSGLVQGLSGPLPSIVTVLMMAGTFGVRLYAIRYKESTRSVGKKHHDDEEDEGAWWPLVCQVCSTVTALVS